MRIVERILDYPQFQPLLRPIFRVVPRATMLQFSKFAIVGVVGFAVDLALFHLGLDVLGFGHYFSALFSFPFAVTVTWIGNRAYTFRGQSKHKPHHEWARFAMVCAAGLVLNRGTFMLLTAFVPLVYDYPVLGLIAGTCVGMFFNFFAAKKVVFQ